MTSREDCQTVARLRPFTVEGVMPEELSLGEEGLFDGTPNEFEEEGRPGRRGAKPQRISDTHGAVSASDGQLPQQQGA